MPLWFVRGLRRGVVTTRYPARPEASAAFLPTPPAFRADHMDAELAGRLCAACPSQALRQQDGALIFDVGACTACGRCQEIAPDAVASSGEFELAATDRAHLIKRIPLRRRADR
jgi:formate hydrogenlyase subunit 6/NADH:ubiquinone oxidoreductase subunit I